MHSSEQREFLNSVLKGAHHVRFASFLMLFFSQQVLGVNFLWQNARSHSRKEKAGLQQQNRFACPQRFCQDMTADVHALMKDMTVYGDYNKLFSWIPINQPV